MTRRSLIGAIRESVVEKPINKQFLQDVMMAIEKKTLNNTHNSSQYYKPSSCVCMRQMYFMRVGEDVDMLPTEYNSISMADTGTRRHVAIQDVLESMLDLGFDWQYIDVADYVEMKKDEGKLKYIEVRGKVGAETKLVDTALHVSFMCDGILYNIKSKKYYLFEFKNQASFKYNGKVCVDADHVKQVTQYCLLLDLNEVLVLYENRDNCMLECPELLIVTDEMKEEQANRLITCEQYVENKVVPPKHSDTKACRWCKYKTACKKY